MAVIKDVARHAGLSVAAVSKYLKNPESVRQDTRERIENAIKELDYRPSAAARALRTGRTGLFSVVIPDIVNPFFAELFTFIRKEAAVQGYACLLQPLGEIAENASVVSAAFAVSSVRRVDGVIVCFPDDEEFLPALASQMGHTPIVLMSWRQAASASSSILLDVRGGIYATTRHLIKMGHKCIAYSGGPADSAISQEKLRGFIKAMSDSKLPILPELIHHGRFAMETGYQAAKNFLIDGSVSAIVAENDILAVGCIKYCHKKKLSVPERVAVTGFDDIPLAAMYEPPITTAKPSISGLAAAAVSRICEIIRGGRGQDEYEPIVVKTELIIRRSTDSSCTETI